ncbi:MAG: hypothetical protein JNK85_00825 [Verrucomicrobiales bacterium]|nr:hypothetical protein [Verrucomicrobiales bacterium]
MQGHNAPENQDLATGRSMLPGLLAALAIAAGATHAQAQPDARFAGRPFVRVARASVQDPNLGFIQGFGRSQIVDDHVVFLPLGNGFATLGVARGRGGPLTVVTRIGAPQPATGAFLSFHDGLAQGPAEPGASAFVFAAGEAEADALFRVEGSTLTSLLASGSTLPNSGGKTLNRLGEPYLVGDQLVVIAWHQGAQGVDFRGIYRVRAAELVPVADTSTALPGPVGIPDTFSSQVGFDGQTLAFWASRGPFTQVEGMFKRTANEPVVALLSKGDALPQGGTVDGLISPPVVADGAVWFFAIDTQRKAHLMREANGTLTRIVSDGDATPDGGTVGSLGQLGLEVDANRVFFASLTAAGPGVYWYQDGALQTVVAAGGVVAGVRPASITLQDAEADTLVLHLSGPGAQPAQIVANLPHPEAPVLLSAPKPVTAAAGQRIELAVTALGDPPLSYVWYTPTGSYRGPDNGQLVINAAAAAHVGYYSVQITNLAGLVNSPSVLVNVEIGPVLHTDLADVTVEAGDPLRLTPIALGGLPLGYSWMRDGIPLTGTAASAPAFVHSSASIGDSGVYQVIVTNAYGSVTSRTAQVTVLPPGPNPTFAGSTFESMLASGTLFPGSPLPLIADAITEGAARWFGDRLVTVATGEGFRALGLIATASTGLETLLTLGANLPGGLGTLGGLRLVDASAATDPIMVFAHSNAVPVGIFRLDGSELVSLIDITMPVPGAEAERFEPFYAFSAQSGSWVTAIGRTARRSGVYLAGDGPLRRLLDTTQDLPVLGTTTAQIQGLGFDGRIAGAIIASQNQSTQAVLRISLDGRIDRIAATGDLIPGTPDTIRGFGTVAVNQGEIYFFAFNPAFARYALAWRDGVIRTVAAPGATLPGNGTLQSIESSYFNFGTDRVYLSGRVRTATGNASQVLAAGTRGLETVLATTKLDGRSFNFLSMADAVGDRVAVAVRFSDGTASYFANTGATGTPAPRLLYQRANARQLAVTVPDGTALEGVSRLGGTWESLPGTGNVLIDVPATGETRFFRLRRP